MNVKPFLAVLAVVVVAGCQTVDVANNSKKESDFPDLYSDPNYFASDEAVKLGKQQFKHGNYGLAEQQFRKAVEIMPKDFEAWVGLAASLDRLRRFDLASQAYSRAIKLGGYTFMINNNLGYHWLLRGDLRKARKYFLAAYEEDPSNPLVANNVKLLNESATMAQRLEKDQPQG